MKLPHAKQSGYILIFTLLAISIAMAVVAIGLTKTTIFTGLSQTFIRREKARQLAMGGIALAMSELIVEEKKALAPKPPAKPGQKQEEQKEEKPNLDKQLLEQIFPLLNRWQTVKLNFGEHGITATIQFCLMSEEGKIDINALYDFENKKFIGATETKEQEQPEKGQENKEKKDEKEQSPVEKAKAIVAQQLNGQKVWQAVIDAIKTKTGIGLSFAEIEAEYKKRKMPFNEPTELMNLPSFKGFKNNIFYEPPSEGKKERSLYLMDIFTIATNKKYVDPWLFTDSMRVVYGLPRVTAEAGKPLSKEVLNNFKENVNWQGDWDQTLKNVYERDYASIPQPLQMALNREFRPQFFSVLSQATVEKVTVKMYAILERIKEEENKVRFVIRNVYAV